MPEFAIIAGMIRLQIPSKVDVFHSELLKFDEYIPDFHETMSTFSPLSRGRNSYWLMSLTKMKPMKVELSGENTVIRGFYEDLYKGENNYRRYEVNIYLFYEEEEPGDFRLEKESEQKQSEKENVVFGKVKEE